MTSSAVSGKPAIDSKHSFIRDLLLPMLLFGSIGTITWAIRGTAGWGGVDGTIVPGLMWGILWYYLSYRKGIDARGIVLWLGLSLALGGELGYGQYVGWIQGHFNVGNDIMPLSPLWGYAWLIMCGIGWAAPGGIVLGWALGNSAPVKTWIIRSFLLASFMAVMFAWPFIDWMGRYLVQLDPGVLFPYSDTGIYSGELDRHLSQTVYTNTQNFLAVAWWIVALIVAALQRDRTTLVTGLIIGGGFGLGFMQSTMWTLGYVSAPEYIDWWKIWELNAGFNLGVLYAITWYWSYQRVKKKEQSPDRFLKVRGRYTEWRDTMFQAVGGFLLIFFAGFEYFFWTGLTLSIFYFVSMLFTTTSTFDAYLITERRRSVSLIFSAFLLVFLLFHGGSERLGIILELYNEDAVSQYSWPFERIMLFAPVALVITGVAVYRLWHVLSPVQSNNRISSIPFEKSLRIVDLMTVTGFIGALSIWPYKIGVIYALFLCFAIWSFNRINSYQKEFQVKGI